MYECAHLALVWLGADEKTMTRFQILLKEDVRASTAILDPNVAGSSSIRLSWIWQKKPGQAGSSPESMLKKEKN